MNNLLTSVVVILALFVLPSCTAMNTGNLQKTSAISACQSEKTSIKNNSSYSIGPEDVVRILVDKHPEWSGEFTVKPDGSIFIEGIGRFEIDGLTEETASIAFASVLEEFITSPKVTVTLVKYVSQSIYVFGEVMRPGKYSTQGKKVTLRDAVVMAGLLNEYADATRVHVISPSSRKRPARQVVNLHRILYQGEMQRNLVLKPGCVVYVPKTFWGKLNEFVRIILSPLTSSVPAAARVAP